MCRAGPGRILGCSSKYEADPRDETKVLHHHHHHHHHHYLPLPQLNNSWHSLTVNETLPSPSLFLFTGVGWYLSKYMLYISSFNINSSVSVSFIYFSFSTVFQSTTFVDVKPFFCIGKFQPIRC